MKTRVRARDRLNRSLRSRNDSKSRFHFEALEQRLLLSADLVVTAFVPTASGFNVQFNQAVDVSTLNLYDTEAGVFGPADVTLTGSTTGVVAGSLAVNGNNVAFVKTAGPLSADTYTASLRSAPNGFKSTSGDLLNGNSGSTNHDYVIQFAVDTTPTVTVGVPDFAAGPGQAIGVPGGRSGIPVMLNEGSGITSIDFTLTYDPELLNMDQVVLEPTLPAGSTLQEDLSTIGKIDIHIASPAGLRAGPTELLRLLSEIPQTADYGKTGVLAITNVQVNNGAIPALADDALEAVAYFGDATGNQTYSALDATRTLRVSVGLDSGFAAYPAIDPTIIADISGNGALSSLDATRILQEVTGFDRVEIPPITPVIRSALASDTGFSSTDGLTSDPTVSGSVRDDGFIASLQAKVDSGDFVDVTGDLQSGSFSFGRTRLEQILGSALNNGAHTLQLRAVDNGGNASTLSTLSFTLDSTIPAITTLGLSAGSDDGTADDNVTSAAIVTLTGVSEPGATIALGNIQAIVPGSGLFQLPGVTLAPGTNSLTVTSTDLAGNSAQSSITVTRQGTTTTDVALAWNQQTLDAIRLTVMDPPVATRVLAMVSLAQYDTLAAIEQTPAYLVHQDFSGPVSVDAALATTAHTVLYALFPSLRGTFDAALNALLNSIANGPDKDNAIALGLSIGNSVLAIRSNDNSDEFVDDTGSTEVGIWRPTAPMYATAEEPQWGDVTPFALSSGDEFRSPPPPALDSAEYAASVEEIQSLGSATSTTRTADETQTAQFWADGKGSYTPPGHWNLIAQQIALSEGSSLSSTVRLLAELNVALADSAIAAWDVKYTYNLWRPIDAIHNADEDNNPATIQDESWTPLLITPSHPEYVSGHSSFSAAAAAVLAATFGDNTPFSTTAFTLPGVTRSFSSFTQAAEEAGRSRIYGGIHYEFTNEAGQVLGQQVAGAVLSRFALTEDLQPPSIVASTTPAVSSGNITLTGQILDNLSGVSTSQYRVDNGSLQTLVLDEQGQFVVTTAFLADGTQDGLHTLAIIARDAAGNSTSFSRTFTLDTSAPQISIATPTAGATLDALTQLTGTVSGTGSAVVLLQYRLDNGQLHPLTFDPNTGAFESYLDQSTLSVGAHQLTVIAQDTAGNQTSTAVAVTLATDYPLAIVGLSPATGSVDVGTTFRPEVYFSRAVDPATLTSNSFYALDSSGTKLAATIVPSQDGMFAWLFFTNPLPSSSTITVYLDGSIIKAAQTGALLDADRDGIPGGVATASFTTVSLIPIPGTTLSGRVVDPGPDLEPMTFDDIRRGPDGIIHTDDDVFLNPLAGVKVYIVGLEDQAVFTDAQGFFQFTAVPTGDVKVAVDGRTATNAPAGLYFPEMVMDVKLRPGVANTLMGSMGSLDEQLANATRKEIYLPRLQTDILKPVSSTVPTIVTVDANSAPDLSDAQRSQVSLQIQPGTLIGPDGLPVANPQIGISMVPSELVRDMLPPGILQHTFDITIQAPGAAVFTAPATLTLPNVFNAAPGTQIDFLSFDHTTGMLVIEGTATVSADGLTVTTDPGTGITKPGWHGATPPVVCVTSTPPSPSSASDPIEHPDFPLPMIFGETGNPISDLPANLFTWTAPGLVPTLTPVPPPSGPCPAPTPSPITQPFIEILIEVDGPLADYMNQAGNLDLTTQWFRLDAGSGETKTFLAKVKNFADLILDGSPVGSLNNLNENILYGSRIKVTKTTGNSNGTVVTDVTAYYLYRFVDATDASHDDHKMEFEDTLVGVTREKKLEVRAGTDSFPVLTVSSPYSMSVLTPVAAGVTFSPTAEGLNQTSTLDIDTPAGQRVGSILLQGDGEPVQYWSYDEGAAVTAIANAFFTKMTPVEQSYFGNPGPGGVIFFDSAKALQFIQQAVGIASAFLGPYNAGFSLDPTGTDHIGDFESGGSGDAAYPVLGRANSGVDLSLNNIYDLSYALTSISTSERAFRLSEALNENYGGDIDIYIDRLFTTFHDPTYHPAGLPADWPYTSLVAQLGVVIAHELGHTLGLVHTTSIDTALTDVMSYAPLGSSLTQGYLISNNALKLALGLPWNETDGIDAVNYYMQLAFSTGFMESTEDPGSSDSIFPSSLADGLLFVEEAATGQLVQNENWGAVDIAGSGLTRSYIVRNVGDQAAIVTGVTLLGGKGQFILSPLTTPVNLAPGATLPLSITFDPTVTGPAEATLQISSDAFQPTVDIALSGFGQTAAPHAFVSAPNNNFGGVAIGGDGPIQSQFATITNQGAQPLIISGIQFSEGSTAFSLVNVPTDLATHPVTLAFGESYTFGLDFSPDKGGLIRGIIDITTNDPTQAITKISAVGTGLGSTVYPSWGQDYVAIETPNIVGSPVFHTISDDAGHFMFSLPPSTNYHITVFDPVTGLVAHGYGTTPLAGKGIDVTRGLIFRASTAPDSDFDGLPDDVENAIGTSASSPDTDRDGLSDYTEIQQGLDPLGGLSLPLGVVGSVGLSGPAKKVVLAGSLDSSSGQTAYVATGSYGLAIVNASKFTQPRVLSELDLTGDAVDVAVDSTSNIAVVAASTALHRVDISNPLQPVLIDSIATNAVQVEIADGVAYVASGTSLESYSVLTGERYQSLSLGTGIARSLAIEGSILYAVAQNTRTLWSIDVSGLTMAIRSSLVLPSTSILLPGNVFVGNGVAYITSTNATGTITGGYATVNVSNPDNLQLISGVDLQIGFSAPSAAFAANGSGLGLLAGPSGAPVTNSIDVMDVRNPANTAVFLTFFVLPVAPLSLSIGSGMAFVGGGNGLYVVNYLDFDRQGIPPVLSVTLPGADQDPVKPGIQVGTGTVLPVRIDVADDQQVRNVELLVNGIVVRNDTSFPWDGFNVTAAPDSPGATTMSIQVRATDTGGNSTLSPLISVDLGPDVTAPQIAFRNISDGLQIANSFRTIRLQFSEAMDPLTLTAQNFQLFRANGQIVTPIDVLVSNNGKKLTLTYAVLPPDFYHFDVNAAAVKDVAGNSLVSQPSIRLAPAFGTIASVAIPGEVVKGVAESDPSNPSRPLSFVISENISLPEPALTAGAQLTILDTHDPANLTIVGQFPILGSNGEAKDIAYDPSLKVVVVATNAGGLQVIDVSNPAAPQLVRIIPSPATMVEVLNGLAYVGTDTNVEVYSLVTGNLVQTVQLPEGTFPLLPQVWKLAREGNMLYAVYGAPSPSLVPNRLQVFEITSSGLLTRGFLNLTTVLNVGAVRDFVVAEGMAYLSAYANPNSGTAGGFYTFSVSNPDSPTLISAPDNSSFGSSAIAVDGGGRALLAGTIVQAVSGISTNVPVLDVMNVTVPANTGTLIQQITLLGKANTSNNQPDSVWISGGIAFVGEGSDGIRVVEYLALDLGTQAPLVSLSAQATDVNPVAAGVQVLENTVIPIRITATDDRQVGKVQLLVNGQVVRDDIAFPWDESIVTPVIAGSSQLLTLQARATDLAGNTTLSAPVVIEVVKDTFAPALVSNNIVNGSQHGATFRTIRMAFSEPMNPATLTAQNLKVLNSLDQQVLPTQIEVSSDGRSVELEFAPFALGVYRLQVNNAAITDQAGNALGAGVTTTTFTIIQSTVSWINPAGGFWDVASNWSTGIVPGANDDVLIDVPGAVTITYRSGNTTINSLHSTKAFTLSGGTLTVMDTIQVDGAFVLTGGTLAHATVLRGAAGSSVSIPLPTQLGEVTFDAVHLQADMTVPTLNLIEFRVRNGLTLDGARITIQSNTSSPDASMIFIGSQTLGGNGEIFFSGVSIGKVLNSGGTLTIGAGITVLGAAGALGGEEGFSDSILINQGTIRSSGTGSQISVNFQSGTTFINQGHLEAINGGSLTVDGIQNFGTLSATGGSALFLFGLWTNPGSITMNDSTLTFGGAFVSTEFSNLTRSGGKVVITGRVINTGLILDLDQNVGSIEFAVDESGAFEPGIYGGTVRSSGQSSILMTGTQQFVFDGVTLGANLTLRSDTTQTFPTLLIIRDGLTLQNVTITLDNFNGGDPTTLRFSGPQTLGGSGQIVVTGTAAARLEGDAAHSSSGSRGPLTIGPGITLRGGGFSFPGLDVINEGVIRAEGSSNIYFLSRINNQGTLQADSGAILFLTIDAQWINTGVMRLNAGSDVLLEGSFALAQLGTIENNGGRISLDGGTLLNAGKTLTLDASTGDLNLLEGATISGGIIRTLAGAKLVAQPVPFGSFLGTLPGTGILDGVTLNGTLALNSNGIVTVRNGLTLTNGTISLTGSGSNAPTLAFEGTQTIAGSGEIVLNAGAFFDVASKITTTGTLTVGPGVHIHGTNATIGSTGKALINQGTITSDQIESPLTLTGSSVTNSGLVEAVNSATALLTNLTNTSSGILSAVDSTIELLGTWLNQGHIHATDSSIVLNGLFTVASLGLFDLNQSSLVVTGTLQNTGTTLTVDGFLELRGGTIIGGAVVRGTGAGVLYVDSPATLDGVTLSVDFDLDINAIVTVRHGLTLNAGYVSMSNDAVLQFDGTQSIAGTGFLAFDSNPGGGRRIVAGIAGGAATALTIGSNVPIYSFSDGTISGLRAEDSVTNLGSIEVSSGRLTLNSMLNAGTIYAFGGSVVDAFALTNTGTITVQDSELDLSGLWTNTGTINVVDTSVLLGGDFDESELTNISRTRGTVTLTGTLENDGNEFDMSANSTGSWRISGGQIVGGTIQSDGTADLTVVSGSSATLRNVTLGVDLTVEDGATLNVAGGLTLQDAVLTLNDLGDGTSVVFDDSETGGGGVFLDGTGEVVFGTEYSNAMYSASGDLTIGSGITIHGMSGTVGNEDFAVINQGTISADSFDQTITVTGFFVVNDFSGTLEARNGGTLFIVNLDTNDGTIYEEPGSHVFID